MNFKSFTSFVCFCLICIYSSECKRKRWKSNSPKRPHIVFVLADDFGYNDVGYHARSHGSQMYTPFLDSLAERGVKLENYYVQPICSPTRGQLLSGRYQIHTGLVHGVLKAIQPYGLPLDNVLLPEQLQHCGYKTHMIGKWHLGFYKDEYLPWNRGFHTFYGFLTGGENYYTRYKCEPKKIRRYCGVDFIDSKTGATNKTWGLYSTEVFLRKARKVIKTHRKNKPMFLYLALQSVHAPLQVPEIYRRHFKHISDRNRRMYGGMVLAMDRMLKELVQYLRDAKMWKDTIFIFSTDNGGQTKQGGNNWPLRGNKGTLWEGGVKGVGFVHGKPLKLAATNAVNNQLIHVSDWLPTIMSAANCPLINGTQRLDGFDQWETIRKNTQSKRTEILHNIDPLFKKQTPQDLRNGFDVSVRSAIRSGKWKLLTGKPDEGLDDWVRPPECNYCHNTTIREEEQSTRTKTASKNIKLYDIVEDPYERYEVSDQFPEIVDLLLSRLVQYNASAVLPLYPPFNHRADPKLFGGFWLPWGNHLPLAKKRKLAQVHTKYRFIKSGRYKPKSSRKLKVQKKKRYKQAKRKRKYHQAKNKVRTVKLLI